MCYELESCPYCGILFSSVDFDSHIELHNILQKRIEEQIPMQVAPLVTRTRRKTTTAE